MNINIADKEKYIPTTNGNDKSDSPIIFNLRFLTCEEQTEMEYFQYSFGSGKAGPVKVKIDNKYIFARSVESIENLKAGDKVIDTAERFMSLRGPKWMADMITEVALHIKNAMEIDEKN